MNQYNTNGAWSGGLYGRAKLRNTELRADRQVTDQHE